MIKQEKVTFPELNSSNIKQLSISKILTDDKYLGFEEGDIIEKVINYFDKNGKIWIKDLEEDLNLKPKNLKITFEEENFSK